ncbi:peptidase S58 family protein [Mycobacterium xenopi 3993]|nr:peptidase S58 family protein [Mycobacterium xenopi 3993]
MNSITDVGGILVGHYHRLDPDAAMGTGWARGVTVVVTRPERSVRSMAAAGRPAPGKPTCSTPPTVCVTSTRC